MNECAKAIRILAAAIVLGALILAFGTENAYESCIAAVGTERSAGDLLCAPGFSR